MKVKSENLKGKSQSSQTKKAKPGNHGQNPIASPGILVLTFNF
jgi:hypothetical protein